MIVDLLRNDIGKICEYGSVKVDNLYEIHSFETVHQMVSRVYGQLKSSIQEIDIITITFGYSLMNEIFSWGLPLDRKDYYLILYKDLFLCQW